jgi:ABC-2 type transport system ATP-binding protein
VNQTQQETSIASDSSDAIVDVRSIEKSYGSWSIRRRGQIDALRGVSLQASAGDVFGLLGPNGAGKTTLIKILLGVVRPTGGTAALFGRPVGTAAARLRVGYLPESLRIDRHHTARSALRYYGRLSRMDESEIKRRSDELLELVGLSGRDRESVKRFSKGMYQRLGLAQALMHNPDLLVLDEPTDGLDPVGRNEVRMVIDRLRDSGKTIFLNSHILQEVELVCTRVAILAKGQIRGIGTLNEIAAATHDNRIEIEIIAEADPASATKTLRRLLNDDKVNIEPLPASARHADGPTYRITLSLPQQSQVDDTVDRLRTGGISIIRIDTKRATLEDTFMQLVRSQEEAA